MTLARIAPSVLPAAAILELTYRCNHACLFCSCPWYATMARGEELSTAEWCELIQTFAGLGISSVTLTGGEALCREDLPEIIEFAADCRGLRIETVGEELAEYEAPLDINLLSNGRAMHDGILELCAKYGINLSLSLPGLSTFNEHTGSDTGPERILELFARAKSFGCTTTVGIAVTRRNLPELFETIGAALLAGADTLLLNRFLPGGRGLSHPELELSVDELREAADIAERALTLSNRTGHFGTELPRCVIDPGAYRQLKIGTGCSAARDFVTVGPNGMLRGCNHSPIELCYWRDHESLATHPVWRAWLFNELYPETCSGCGFKAECAGGCREGARVKSGDPKAPDPILLR